MVDEPGTTDVDAPSQTTAPTDVVPDGSIPPASDAGDAAPGTPPTTAKPGTVDPANLREGLSRKERKEAREKKVDEFIDKSIAADEDTSRENEFGEKVSTLDDTAKAEAKTAYDAEVSKLVSLGTSKEQAHKIALNTAENSVKAKEQAETAAGREGAQLPPSGNGVASTQKVYTNDQLCQMPTAEAVKIRQAAHRGEVQITM